MRVLLLSQWFDPEPTFKGLLFAQELRRRGHDVEVLTGFPNYPGGRVYPGHRMSLYRREVVDGIVVHRVPLYPSHDRSAAGRVANYTSFALSASVAVLLLRRRPNVLYVYHPPATVALPALVARVVRGVPFVYDVQDLWPETLAATGMIDSRRVLDLVGRGMRATYAKAAHVVVLSSGFRDRLLSQGVPDRHVTVIENWCDESQIERPERAAARAATGFGDEFVVLFAGTMGAAQALDTVLDCAHLMRADAEVRFVLVGSGIDQERLRHRATDEGLENVTFLPRRPPAEMGELLSAADALLVHLRDDPLFDITIPSKTQAYLRAGRPILMGVRGDAGRLVEDAGAGVTFAPEDPAAMGAAVRTVRHLSPEKRNALGERGQSFYEDHLSLTVGVNRFTEVLTAAAQGRRPWQRTKRATDVVVASAALSVLSVPMAFIAVVVQRRLGSPVLFRQTRPGRHGVPFEIVKFRTMTQERNERNELLPDAVRLTKFGSWLRTSSLDELPELWNVIKGDMSLVGPRPLLLRYTPFFSEREIQRLDVRPGITGLAQVEGRNLASWTDRLALDVRYVERMSPVLDAKIIWRTLRGVVTRSGAVADPESIMRNLDDERAPAPAVPPR